MREGWMQKFWLLCSVFILIGGHILGAPTENLQIIQQQAQQGDPYAQATLSDYYLTGYQVAFDDKLALTWAQQSADQGHPLGVFHLANIYRWGIEVKPDSQQAEALYAQALEGLQELAQQGDAAAQSAIGWMYFQGVGVPENLEKAAEWLQSSANQGHYAGQTDLGLYFLFIEDYENAFYWLRQAAEQGVPMAQDQLGVLYEDGYAVEMDWEKAVMWYRRAAEQGLTRAQVHLGRMYEDGSGVEENGKEALRLYHQAADRGSAFAFYTLGEAYEYGFLVEKDLAQALKWYHSAAEKEFPEAYSQLGNIYFLGKRTRANFEVAMDWYHRAAQHGYYGSGYTIGKVYETLNEALGVQLFQSPWQLLGIIAVLSLLSGVYFIASDRRQKTQAKTDSTILSHVEMPLMEGGLSTTEPEIFRKPNSIAKMHYWSLCGLTFFNLLSWGALIGMWIDEELNTLQDGIVFVISGGLFTGLTIFQYWIMRGPQYTIHVTPTGVSKVVSNGTPIHFSWQKISGLDGGISHLERDLILWNQRKKLRLSSKLENFDTLIKRIDAYTQHLYTQRKVPTVFFPTEFSQFLHLSVLAVFLLMMVQMLSQGMLEAFLTFAVIMLVYSLLFLGFPQKVQIHRDKVVIFKPFRKKTIAFRNIQEVGDTEVTLNNGKTESFVFIKSPLMFKNVLYRRWKIFQQ